MIIRNKLTIPIVLDWASELGRKVDAGASIEVDDSLVSNPSLQSAITAGAIEILSYDESSTSPVMQDELTNFDGDVLDITFTPSNYTPDDSPAEAADLDDLAAHLKGIDTALVGGPPGGPAGGDLSGTYPDPDVVDDSHNHTNSTITLAHDDLGSVTSDQHHAQAHAADHLTTDELDGDKIDIDFTPTDYTPDDTPAEADDLDDLAAHLKGIDNKLQTITVQKEPMGFEDPEADITISWSDSTKKLTITPTGASFNVWVKGTKYIKTGAQEKDISGSIAEGYWYFYYDDTGALQGTSSDWNFEEHAPVSFIYWDATNSKALLVAWEPHGIIMDWATHEYLHLTVNTRWRNGLATSGNISGDGSVDSHAYVGVSAGTVYDEDLIIAITSGVGGGRFEQDLASPAKIPVWYLDGATPVWRADTATSFALKQGTSRIAYNLDTAGTWTQPDASSNGNYVAMWLFATNDQSQPIIAVLGQREDNKLSDAQDNNLLSSLSLSNMYLSEMKPIARLIFQTSTAYANTPHARLRDILDLRSLSVLPIGNFVVISHGALAGRSDANSHPASAISTDTTNFDQILSGTDIDVQTALETLDEIFNADVDITGVYKVSTTQVVGAQQAAEADVAAPGAITTTGTADGTYDSTEQNMLNNLKSDVNTLKTEVTNLTNKINALLAKLRTHGLIDT